jgi:ParB-like chromosome segregation protein Spo0J
MKVVTKAVADLIPYVRNSRTHSDAQVAQIAASIKEFGWTNPILIDGENGIIAGHGRLLAARKLGQDKVPVIELAHMTDAQKRAYVIADNKLALNADWDHELLRLEIEDIENEINLNLLGFSNFELNQILGLDEIEQKSTTGEIDPDQFQMEHKCPKCGFEFDDDK